MNVRDVVICTETIRLQDFLKYCGAVGSGGEAKRLVQEGAVRVCGETETRRGRKLRPGDEVALGGNCWRVKADGAS